jgi:hypothetical protein
MGSFALQAMNVAIAFVKCYLRCLQTMEFFLKTEFGLTKMSYGGNKCNIFMGLAQGSGSTSSAWLAVSTLIVHAYKRAGYGATLYNAWSRLLLIVGAILYVDDTNLLCVCALLVPQRIQH